MAQPTIQTSFASGEWAPKLRSRVDIQKYRSGASLLRNFYVDYAGGGASTRQGTRFVAQCASLGARLIPFQPSTSVSYVLEFGNYYIRFYTNGAPVLETAVTGGTAAAGHTFTITNSFNVNDRVLAQNWRGLTNVNGEYFIVAAGTTGSNVVVNDINGNPVTFTGTYTSGGQLSRVYTLPSPYATSDLFPNPITSNPGLKWVQDVTSLIICHPSYQPQILTINSTTNWTITAIDFGSTITAPTSPSASNGSVGTTWEYAYVVTAVDINGQESAPSAIASTGSTLLISASDLAITVTWTASPGAISYNVYKASPTYNSAVPTGAQFGFIGNVTGTTFIESTPGIASDFLQTPPIVQNPFSGSPVQGYAVTANGSYTTVPVVTISGGGGSGATAIASLGVILTSINLGGVGYSVGQVCTSFAADLPGTSVVVTVTSVSGGSVTGVSITYAGSVTSGSTASNPIRFSGGVPGDPLSLNLTWGVTQVLGVQGGEGYTSVPSVVFSAGSAAATASLGTMTSGNPGVPGFLQERLWLAAQQRAVQTTNISQPSSFFNFNTSNPTQDDDAIQATIISEELNDIRNLTPVPTGMIAFTGKGAWLLNGGGGISTMNPITPTNITAQPQAFNGANDLRPLKINMDILYGTNKGNYVRDLSYNLYAQIFTGSDISVYSNHLFFNYYIADWCWAEEPFKTAWVVRNDGILLSLGYVKEQDLIGWGHHDTSGQFTSVCEVIETVNGNVVDAVYVVVQRTINNITVQYIERMADRYFTYGYEDAWSVDCALQTIPQVSPTGTLIISGDPSSVGNVVILLDNADTPFTATMATNKWVVRAGGGIYTITGYTSSSQVTATVTQVPPVFNSYASPPFAYAVLGYTIWEPVMVVTGLTQLIGQTVTGVADGAVIAPQVVSATGTINLSASATKVTLGLAFLPQLQTLPLDLGEPTVQGKRKKIVALNLRVADTLGLEVGTTFANAVVMKDFTLGNIGTQSNQLVTGLVSGDGRTIIDQDWQEAGNYCIQQVLPYPATVLGAMPEVIVGDTGK